MVRSDKFKTGIEQYLHKDVVFEDNRDVIVGRLPVMVKSDSCWMSGIEKDDCDFDHGGYFIIKGAEKVTNFFSLFLCPVNFLLASLECLLACVTFMT